METRLQSSEVRIPKVESGGGDGGNLNFDLSTKTTACPYFQSSFARSLSFNQNQSQSLDFELSFHRLGAGDDECFTTTADNMSSEINNIEINNGDGDDELYATLPPPLPITAPPPPPLFSNGLSSSSSSHSTIIFNGRDLHSNGPQSLPPLHQMKPDRANDTVTSKCGTGGMQPISVTPTKRRFTTNNLNRSHQVSLFLRFSRFRVTGEKHSILFFCFAGGLEKNRLKKTGIF